MPGSHVKEKRIDSTTLSSPRYIVKAENLMLCTLLNGNSKPVFCLFYHFFLNEFIIFPLGLSQLLFRKRHTISSHAFFLDCSVFFSLSTLTISKQITCTLCGVLGLLWPVGIRWARIRILKKTQQKAKLSAAGGYDLAFFLVKVSIAVNRHHNHGSSYKRECLVGAGLEFRGLV